MRSIKKKLLDTGFELRTKVRAQVPIHDTTGDWNYIIEL